MKYRRLHRSELEELREEFVQFLAAHSITAEDWIKIKAERPEAVDELINLFSEIVWDKILSKINFLEMRRAGVMRVMKFSNEKTEMIEIRIESENFDFTDPNAIRSVAEGSIDLNALKPKVLKGAKPYSGDRKLEIFAFLEEGAQPCKESLWRGIHSMIGQE